MNAGWYNNQFSRPPFPCIKLPTSRASNISSVKQFNDIKWVARMNDDSIIWFLSAPSISSVQFRMSQKFLKLRNADHKTRRAVWVLLTNFRNHIPKIHWLFQESTSGDIQWSRPDAWEFNRFVHKPCPTLLCICGASGRSTRVLCKSFACQRVLLHQWSSRRGYIVNTTLTRSRQSPYFQTYFIYFEKSHLNNA